MKKKPALILTAVLAVLVLVVAFVIAWRLGWLEIFLDQELLQEKITGAGIWGPLFFFLVQFAQVLLAPIPGNVTAMAGSALFGFGRSFLISSLAILLGSVVVFLLSRHLGDRFVRHFVTEEQQIKYRKLLEGRSELTLAVMFLFPLISFVFLLASRRSLWVVLSFLRS